MKLKNLLPIFAIVSLSGTAYAKTDKQIDTMLMNCKVNAGMKKDARLSKADPSKLADFNKCLDKVVAKVVIH